MSSIPQVNLNDYLSGNSKSKEKFIKNLGKGFSEIGFVGAALSTFLVITVFNLIKVAFVWWAYKIVPWGKDSLVILMLIVVLLVPFYFWQLPFEPLVNMVIKVGLTSLLYLIFSYQFKLSDNINALMDKGIKKLESVVRNTDSN